ncbi:hypothetical protein BH11PLA1_BH11PLA1_04040 [soil metagenome]
MNSRNHVKWAVMLGVATLIGLMVGTVMRRLGWGEYAVAVSIGMAVVAASVIQDLSKPSR